MQQKRVVHHSLSCTPVTTQTQKTEEDQQDELKKIAAGASYADDLGITVNAGHGLTYHNVAPIAQLPEIYELNIGHSM